MAETGLRYEPPKIAAFHPLSIGEPQPSLLSQSHPAYLTPKISLIEERQVVDFEQRAIAFERVDKAFGIVVWQYRYDELGDYISDREKFAFADLWRGSEEERFKAAAQQKKGFNPLQMELNVQYPSWAQRLLGKEPPKLSITGYEEIIVSYEYTKDNVVGSNYDQRGHGGLSFDQNNQFTVNGSVGRLINVNIKASTKQGVDASDANDPFKNFKIEYKGEGNELEDEVVQEVSAGAVSFQMPGASLAGYSEGHQGLLGLQVKTKFGPLELTTIASQERGEAQKTSFDLVNGASNTDITEKQFVPNKRFFLDTLYLHYYLRNHEKVPDGKKVDRSKLQIWLHTQQTDVELRNVPTQGIKSKFCYLGSKEGPPFKLLVEGKDYSASDIIEGCISFDSIFVQDADIVGICMATNDASMVKGDTSSIKPSDSTIVKQNLWTLKSQNPVSSDSTFSLAWRNVYQLPNDFDVSKFKIQVQRVPESGTPTDRAGTFLYSAILGLTDNTGAPYSTNRDVYDNDAHLLIIPPFATAAGTLSNLPFANPALGAGDTSPALYTLGLSQNEFNELKPKYKITMTGSTKKSTFQLGSGNIMDKSEKVTGQDGEVLKRDEDYTLDYQFGTLTLISKRALSKTRIDVEYQSETLFVPKSKTFLGMHGEMKLPFGQNSFVGASILYQNAASQAQIPKIQQEPYSKVLLDANTKIDFEPQWMTELMDKIPLLTTEDKSTASLEVEVANSRTNPNTDGQAYIDDFESSNRPFDLGLDQGAWWEAAPPAYLDSGNYDSLLHCPPAWLQYWYQPRNSNPQAPDAEVFKDSLFYKLPLRHSYTSEDKYEPVMNFVCQPAPDNSLSQQYKDDNLNPWAGIMHPIPSGSMDRTRDKYLEFYARGTGGRLYIDMGEVSEDICFLGGPPNHRTGNEDTSGTGTAAFNEHLDVGVDGLTDKNEYYLVPNAAGATWDTLYYQNSLLPYPNDPAKDNYQTYSVDASHPDYLKNYPHVDGKEKNSGPPYDSKDLLGDGLSTAANENYFRRFIDFDSVNADAAFNANAFNYRVFPDSTLGNANVKNGWHLFRIPLNDTLLGGVNFQKRGSPRWDRIRFIRLFWTDFNPQKRSQSQRLQFARMRLARNEWQEQPMRIDSSTTAIKLTVSTINTEDNPEYTPPPGIARITDEGGNIVKETSLKLNFSDIHPGDTALVKNVLVNQSINLSAYTTMTMFVHGDPQLNPEDLQYFFRFGNDDSTYYEYRTRLYTSTQDMSKPNKVWDARNTMNINLHEFSTWKLSAMKSKGNPASLDFTDELGTYSFSIKYRNNRPPNFAGITWMAIGVMRGGAKNTDVEGYTGELWVDELKVSGVHNFNGWATRATFNTAWAGFMNLGGRVDYTGADFQQMTNTDMKLGATSLSGNAQVSWALNKFLPTQWGVTVPLGASVSSTLTRPTLVQNTDVYLTDAKTNSPDGLMKMYKDYLNMLFGRDFWENSKTQSERYQSATVSRTFYTGWDKTNVSKNPIVNFLLERLSLDYNYNYSLTQTARGPRADNAGLDYIDSLTTDRYSGSIKYDLSPKPAPAWTKWKPFAASKRTLLPERLKNYELSLLPSTLNFTLADVNYTKSEDIKYNVDSLGKRTSIPMENLTLTHNANMAYDPISILKLNYTLTINRNLDRDVNDPAFDLMSTSTKWKTIFKNRIAAGDPVWKKYLILAGERDRTQNATLNFDPTLWDWLTWSADYSANYKQNAATLQNDSTPFLNLGLTGTFHLTTTLTVATLFKKLSDGLPNLKTAAAVFGSIEKGLGKISFNSINFSYNAAMTLTNNYVDEPYLVAHGIGRSDFLLYQLGLKGRSAWDVVTGNLRDDVFGGMRFRNGYQSSPALQSNDKEDRRTSDRSYSASTSFSLPEPIGVSISNLSVKYSKSYSIQPDTSYRDTTTTWPQIDVGATSQVLNKIKFVTSYLQNVSMSSNYTYQKKIQKSHKPGLDDTVTGLQNRFSPLIGVDGKLKKWPISVNYSHTYNSTSDESKKTGKNTSTEHLNKMTLNYELQKTNEVSEFKLLLWTVPLKGTFTAGVDFEQGTTESQQYAAGNLSEAFATQTSSHYSFGPHSSYSFSDNITGRLSFSASQTKKESETQTSYIFKLSVNIALK